MVGLLTRLVCTQIDSILNHGLNNWSKEQVKKCSCMTFCQLLPNDNRLWIIVYITSLGKTKMASEEIDPQPHKYWPSIQSLKAFVQKTYRRHYYLLTLPRPSIPYTEGRWNKSY